MTPLPRLLAGIALLALMALAGCADLPQEAPAPGLAMPVPPPESPPADLPPSPLSQSVRVYYAQVQAHLLAQGLLRTVRGGPDAPFNDRNLTDNFIQVALYDEYASDNGQFVQRQTASRLRRWEVPVRIAVEFGATVPLVQRSKDVGDVGRFAGELASATGHPVTMSPENANFHVLILNEDDRRAAGARLRTLVPGISAADLATVIEMPRETYCLVFAYSNGNASSYDRAVAVIRGEHPDLLRLSCIHEELAQGMGLANDSPAARPSIFNDDEEFALLTGQDRLMLRMLYDTRLHPGMTAAEAEPIVRVIAAEMMSGTS